MDDLRVTPGGDSGKRTQVMDRWQPGSEYIENEAEKVNSSTVRKFLVFLYLFGLFAVAAGYIGWFRVGITAESATEYSLQGYIVGFFDRNRLSAISVVLLILRTIISALSALSFTTGIVFVNRGAAGKYVLLRTTTVTSVLLHIFALSVLSGLLPLGEPVVAISGAVWWGVAFSLLAAAVAAAVVSVEKRFIGGDR